MFSFCREMSRNRWKTSDNKRTIGGDTLEPFLHGAIGGKDYMRAVLSALDGVLAAELAAGLDVTSKEWEGKLKIENGLTVTESPA